MGARLVLLAFVLLYVLVGVALSPAHGLIAPADDWVSTGLMLATLPLMIALDYPATPLSRALGVADQNQAVALALLLVVCLLIAAFAIVRLRRKDGGGKAGATFLLLLAVSVPAGVVLTLYQFTQFGH